MTVNLTPDPAPVSEERRKLAWFRLRDDGKYDVVMYYPKTDKFKRYVGEWAISLVGEGTVISGEDMVGSMLVGVEKREWSLADLLYFWRAK